jgi:hypothetical protein
MLVTPLSLVFYHRPLFFEEVSPSIGSSGLLGHALGHFPGAKQVRNALVRINSLADVERIITDALDHPYTFSDEGQDVATGEPQDSELDLSCAC